MRFQDQFPVVMETDDFVKEEEEYDFFKEENGESQDMWSLMRSEPRSDAFSSLLAGDGGKECKFDAKIAAPWDLVTPKPYFPLARSRSSLSNDSLQLCTEGLGCESCDCLLDSTSSSASSVIADEYFAREAEIEEEAENGENEEQEKNENEENEENEEDEDEDEDEDEFEEEKSHSARSFPPPLLTLGGSSAAHLRSFKKDGRFVLQSVKAPLQNFLHMHRVGGRLQMHLVSTTEDDEVALPLAPKLQNEVLPEEGLGEEEAPEICLIPALSDIPALHQSKPFPEDSSDNQCDSSMMKCNKSPAPVEFKIACSKPPEKCKGVDNESSNGKREIQEGKSSPKQSASCNQNIYNGWRSEIGEQNSAVFCQNLQKAQALPNYPVNKLKYWEPVSMINVHVNVNDHARFSKFRVKDLGMARCHDANSVSVWGKYPCIATSS